MIIGINGAKGAGKDTIGKLLVEEYDFTRISFAGLLKESAAALFNVSVEQWEEWKNDPDIKVSITRSTGIELELAQGGIKTIPSVQIAQLTAREFLQRYGTEAHRDIFGSDFWVDALLDGLSLGDYVITDARFDNELRAIHDAGGFNIRVVRPSTGPTDSHVSEAEPDWSLIDYKVNNAGTIQYLYSAVRKVLEMREIDRVVA